jgi:hypothetical protein
MLATNPRYELIRLSCKENSLDMPASTRESFLHRGNLCSREPLTLEEEGDLVGNQITGKVLRGVNQTGDNGLSQVGALEKMEECRFSTHLGINSCGSSDHSSRHFAFLDRFLAESFDRFKSLLSAADANQPPWRFRCKEHEDQKRSLNRLADYCRYRIGRRASRERSSAEQEEFATPTDRFAG